MTTTREVSVTDDALADVVTIHTWSTRYRSRSDAEGRAYAHTVCSASGRCASNVMMSGKVVQVLPVKLCVD